MEKIKLTPEHWCQLTGIIVWDPDGWNRSVEHFDKDWATPLTFEEFIHKCSYSTTNGVNGHVEVCTRNIERNIMFSL